MNYCNHGQLEKLGMWRNIGIWSMSWVWLFCSLHYFWTKQVLQRHFLRSGKILGTFKLDVATVMAQQGILLFFLVRKNVGENCTGRIFLFSLLRNNEHNINYTLMHGKKILSFLFLLQNNCTSICSCNFSVRMYGSSA